MKASELIAELQKLIAEHGDLEVGIKDHEYDEYLEICSVEPRHLRRIPNTMRPHILEGDSVELGDKFIGIS